MIGLVNKLTGQQLNRMKLGGKAKLSMLGSEESPADQEGAGDECAMLIKVLPRDRG